jgi:hypothetical protein
MKRNHLLGLVLSGLCLVATVGSIQAGLFTGSFDPANWELDAARSSNPGTYAFTGSGGPDTLQITGAAAGLSETYVVLQAPYSSAPTLLHFAWSVANNGNVNTPQTYYLVDGTATEIQNPGALTVELPAYTEFGFALGAETVVGKTPAVFAITEWNAVAVPEAGTWLTGLLGLGGALFEVVRRQRRRATAA